MLQNDEAAKVNAVLDEADGQRGVLIAVLQKVQEKLGYLPEDAMKMIADRLELSLNKSMALPPSISISILNPVERTSSRSARAQHAMCAAARLS